MRFNINQWKEIKPYEKEQSRTGSLRIMCSKESPVYVTSQGVETLIGVGTDVRVEVAEVVDIHVEAEGEVRVFVETVHKTARKPVGEKFTNADRMPMESGSVTEVKKALRLLKVQEKQMQQRFTQQMQQLNKASERDTDKKEAEEEEPDDTNPTLQDPADETTE